MAAAIVGIRNRGFVDFAVFDQIKHAFLHEFEERSESSLIIPSRWEGSYRSSLHRRLFRSCVSQSVVSPSTCAEFGTSNGPLSSLVSDTTPPSPSGVDFWQGLTLDGRLVSGRGARHRTTWTVFIDLRGTRCVTGLCTHSQADTACALHPEFAIHPNQEVAHTPHHVNGPKET